MLYGQVMAKVKYKEGDRFSSWTLLVNYGGNRALARCDCGVTKICWVSHMASGKSTRCRSCYGVSKRTAKVDYPETYGTWSSMIQRCTNQNNARYHQYGGRGIVVCDKWMLFESFFNDLGPRPAGTSLDRIDVDGPYCKENCRWATSKEQMRNRRDTKNNVFGKAITEVAEGIGMNGGTLASRLKRGWSTDRALSEHIHDKTQSLRAKCRELGVSYPAVRTRISRGWSMEDAFSRPVQAHAKAKCR